MTSLNETYLRQLDLADCLRAQEILTARIKELVFGTGFPAGDPASAELLDEEKLLAAHQMIQAIKAYRERTRVGLREAKEAVDSYLASVAQEKKILNEAEKSLIRDDRRILAMRALRLRTGCTLPEAQGIVDAYSVEAKPATQPGPGVGLKLSW